MKKIIAAVAAVLVVLQLSGCAGALIQGITYAESAAIQTAQSNKIAKDMTSESTSQSIVLTRQVSADRFIAGVRALARDNKYRVWRTQIIQNPIATGPIATATIMESHDSAVPLFGKSWAVTMTLQLQSDGKTITVNSSINGEGGPSADEVASRFKKELLEKFS